MLTTLLLTTDVDNKRCQQKCWQHSVCNFSSRMSSEENVILAAAVCVLLLFTVYNVSDDLNQFYLILFNK